MGEFISSMRSDQEVLRGAQESISSRGRNWRWRWTWLAPLWGPELKKAKRRGPGLVGEVDADHEWRHA